MLPHTFTSFPVLKTERLTLRKLSINDDIAIFALRSDKQVNKYLDRQPADTIEDARKFIDKITEVVRQNESLYWAITMGDDDKLIGTICLFNFQAGEQIEIGYELLPAFQLQGIMQEALSKVIAYAFDVLKLKSIEAHTHLENKSSTKLLEKHHFRKQENINDDSNNIFVTYKLSAFE